MRIWHVLHYEFLLLHANDHKVFPPKVLTRASKVFWDSKDERGVWDLAGTGWKTILTSYRDTLIKDYVSSFHTPRPAQIDTLYESLLGFSSLSSHWHWKRMTSDRAKAKLNELVTLRGSIAHRVSTSKSVTKREAFNQGMFVHRLVETSSNAVREFIYSRTKEYPWGKSW